MSGSNVKPQSKRAIKNPGAAKFNAVYSKRTPRPVDQWTDHELLSVVLGSSEAATSVMERIGKLDQFSTIGEGANMLHRPGISKATALRLDVIFEIATRIG